MPLFGRLLAERFPAVPAARIGADDSLNIDGITALWPRLFAVGQSYSKNAHGSMNKAPISHPPARRDRCGLRPLTISLPGPRSGLDAAAMVRPGDVWAVGAYQARASDLPLAVHFNGKRWAAVPVPRPSAGWTHFFGVAGRGSKNVWAVGTYAPSNAGWPQLPFRALAGHWDGSRWRFLPAPQPGAASTLFEAAVLGPHDAWAAGGYYDSKISFQNLQCEHTAHTLIEHWDGRAWSIVASPDPGQQKTFAQPCGPDHPHTSVNVLSGISAAGPNDIWAVGHFWDGARNRTLTLHWNGRRWARMPSPNASRAENVLYAVWAVSPRQVWAAGAYRPGPNAHYRTLIERWNGRTWRVLPSPNAPGQDNQIYALTGWADDVWAAGRHDGTSGGGLVEHWDGSRWKIVPNQKAGHCACANNFNGIAAGPGGIWIAGEYVGANVHDSLIEAGPRVCASQLAGGSPSKSQRAVRVVPFLAFSAMSGRVRSALAENYPPLVHNRTWKTSCCSPRPPLAILCNE